MKLLLDTHIALWAISDDPRFSPQARELIAAQRNIIWVSAVSIWEIAIKHSFCLFYRPGYYCICAQSGGGGCSQRPYSHSTPIARLGGLGIAVSLVLSCLMFLPINAFAWAFLAVLLAIIVTGLIDGWFK